MIRFLLGRTGSGKTETVTREIRELLKEKRQQVYYIVPEQQLFSVERDILSSLPPDETKYLNVTSFTKLCDILEETYGGRAHTSLTNAAGALLMWQNLRELSGMFSAYDSVPSGDVSLTRKMLDTFKELSANGITSQALEDAADSLQSDSPLKAKLCDIAMIMASYQQLTAELCGQDPSDRLQRAAEKSRKHRIFDGAEVYLDSFTSFTAQEYNVLALMIGQADRVTVTLGLDDPLSHEPQFDSLKDTYRKLNALSSTIGSERCVQKLTKDASLSEISLLESALWDFSASPYPQNSDIPRNLRLFTAPNPYEEAEATALHILALSQEGIGFGEMAVVVRDMNQWKGILDVALEQYHIPFFLSEKTDLNTKPAARLLLLALKCIGRHYQIGDVMSLCKTGLCGIDLRDLDYFEEYTETWHLTGNRLTDPLWSMNPDGYKTDWSARGKAILSSANRVKDQVMIPLMALEAKLKAAESVTDQCKALYEYLCDLSVKKQLSDQGTTYLELGLVREAGETVRLWSFINEALSTLASVSSIRSNYHLPMSADELSSALSLIYAETDIGSVPARHDCVMIGNADTLRVDHIKASLLLGLCEGEFPRAVTDHGLFSEQDKALLYERGIEFSSRAEMMTSEELLYVYRAMTKPTEYLYLSHSLAGTDGKELSPSAAFTRVGYLFPYIKILPFSASLLNKSLSSSYVPPTEDQLSPPRAYALFGEEMWLSRSKLQRYAYCPYSYYGSYILKLREQMSAQVDYLTSGLFLHHVLETFLRHAMDEDGKLRPVSETELIETADKVIDAYVRSINHSTDICHQGRFLHTFERLRSIALTLLRDIVQELSHGSFTPIGFEWDTHGYTPDDPLPMTFTLRDDTSSGDLPVGIEKGRSVLLKMGGVIDRVDIYRTEDGKTAYIRVVDYKSSKHELSEKTMTEDMDVQLLLYLFTLCLDENRHLFADENGRIPESVLPAQAMYLYPTEDSDTGDISAHRSGILVEDRDIIHAANHDFDLKYLPEGIKMKKDGSWSGNALCSQERLESLQSLLMDTIHTQASNMYGGIAHRTASADACQYCNMRLSCPIFIEKPHY